MSWICWFWASLKMTLVGYLLGKYSLYYFVFFFPGMVRFPKGQYFSLFPGGWNMAGTILEAKWVNQAEGFRILHSFSMCPYFSCFDVISQSPSPETLYFSFSKEKISRILPTWNRGSWELGEVQMFSNLSASQVAFTHISSSSILFTPSS